MAKRRTSRQKGKDSRQRKKTFCFSHKSLSFCREVFSFVVSLFVFAVRFFLLPWGSFFWWWGSSFCRIVGHRINPLRVWELVESLWTTRRLVIYKLSNGSIQLLSLGLYNSLRGFRWASTYKRRGLMSGIKKSFEMCHSRVNRNTFLILLIFN